MAENKLFEVTRKHPKENNPYDLTVGNEYYRKGQVVSRNIFIKVYGNEKAADLAIADMKKVDWIKDYKGEGKKAIEIPAESKPAEIKPKGKTKK